MKYLILLSSLIISFCARGQKSDSVHYKQITLTLSPIAIDNGKYYFNGQRVKYEEIVLPLISLNDKEINRRVKAVRTMRELFMPIFICETAYLLTTQLNGVNSQAQIRQLTFTYIGLFALNELYRMSIQIKKRKAINRYNYIVLHPSASVSPMGGLSVGLHARF